MVLVDGPNRFRHHNRLWTVIDDEQLALGIILFEERLDGQTDKGSSLASRHHHGRNERQGFRVTQLQLFFSHMAILTASSNG